MPPLVQFIRVFGDAQPSGIGALGIDPIAILAQAGTFLLLFYLIKRFALTGIVRTLEKRRKVIDDGIRLGREMEAEKAKLDEKVDVVLHKARAQADDIVSGAHDEASKIMKEAEDKATKKVAIMLDEAANKIDDEINQARRALRHETLQLVSRATEIVASEKLDSQKDQALIERALEEVQ